MLAVGIDLGTTHSLISVLRENGSVELIKGADGNVLTPSVVGLSDKNTLLVGNAARARLVRSPNSTVAAVKRTIGTEKNYSLGNQSYNSSEISALILRKLKADLDAIEPEAPIETLVISVPAYFNSAQRDATVLAAELAGLPRPHLINEPTAAAMAYGLHDKGIEQTIMVLDLGGGTFDVSIVEMFEGVMEVRSSSGDTKLGGEDFTQIIVDDIISKSSASWEKLPKEDQAKVIATAEAIKRRLSEQEQASSNVVILDRMLEYSLSRSKFEELCGSVVLKMRRPIEQALYDAKLTAEQIDRVVLVGGATRMLMVRSLAARILRKLPESGLDPDQVVAYGAAVQAGLISNDAALSDVIMTDVAPFSLGIRSNVRTATGEIPNGFAPIIERNTILPASRMSNFTTISEGQTEIAIKVYQGESPIAEENVKIGSTLVRVPPNKPGKESVAVRFSYDTSGLLQVEVTVNSTGLTQELVIENNARSMSASEKRDRLRALDVFKVHPRDTEENLVLLERLKRLYAMLLGIDRAHIMDLIAEFEGVLDRQDPREVARYKDQLVATIENLERNYVR